MGWLSYANYNAIPAGIEFLSAYGRQTQVDHVTPDTGDPYDRVRERAQASWRWRGLDAATAQMLVGVYSAGDQRQATKPNAGSYLYTEAAPVLGASAISVYNISPNTADLKIKQGWKLQLWGDPTIYTVSADADTPDDTNALNTKIISHNRVAGVAFDRGNSKIYYMQHPASAPGTVNIYRCNLAGGADTLIYNYTETAVNPHIDVASTNDKVFFNNDGVVEYISLDGLTGPATAYTAGGTIACVRADDTNDYLYIADAAILKRTDMTGGSAATIATSTGLIRAIMPDENTAGVYWVEIVGGEYFLWRTDSAAGAPIKIKELESPFWVDYDAESGMMFTNGSGDNTLWRARPDGTSSQEIINGLDPAGTDVWDMRAWVKRNTVVNCGTYDATANAGLFTSNIFTEAVSISVAPVLTAAAVALGIGAQVYFFITESADGTRANDANGWHVQLRAQYLTRWVNGPVLDQG